MQAEQRKAIILPIDFSSTESRFPTRSLDSYLLYGNLPGYYGENINSWKETLKTYADLYLENEIRQENIVGNMGAFVRFLKLAAIDAGQIINYLKMASIVGVAVNTLRNFYQVLEDTFIGIRINSFSSSRKRVTSAPRFIFFDIGVRHILADLPLKIKWTDKLNPHDARHVEKLITEHSHKCDRGFVVCRTPINQQLTDRVTALP